MMLSLCAPKASGKPTSPIIHRVQISTNTVFQAKNMSKIKIFKAIIIKHYVRHYSRCFHKFYCLLVSPVSILRFFQEFWKRGLWETS